MKDTGILGTKVSLHFCTSAVSFNFKKGICLYSHIFFLERMRSIKQKKKNQKKLPIKDLTTFSSFSMYIMKNKELFYIP